MLGSAVSPHGLAVDYIVRYYLSRCQKIQLPSCAVIPAFKLEASKFLVAIETYFPIVSISIIPSFVLN